MMSNGEDNAHSTEERCRKVAEACTLYWHLGTKEGIEHSIFPCECCKDPLHGKRFYAQEQVAGKGAKKLTEAECAKLSEEDKIQKYRAGEYCFRAPPVPPGRWDEQAWIRYIDGTGGFWLVAK